MDLSNVVKETPELSRARKLLYDRQRLLTGLGIKAPPTGILPEITDVECIALSQEFDAYTYTAIRSAFPRRA